MKDILKNPVLYYIAVPVLVSLWPILVFAVYLPQAKTNKQTQIEMYKKGQDVIEQIRTLDPDRLKPTGPNDTEVTFTYDIAVNQIAVLCNMPASQYTLNPTMPQTTGGQKTQTAKVSLKQVDITTFAKFLSLIQTRWPGLQCTNLKLDTKENMPDVWDIIIDFKYYY
jgi:hypothetical protein